VLTPSLHRACDGMKQCGKDDQKKNANLGYRESAGSRADNCEARNNGQMFSQLGQKR
jgi:hypothetical protein